jgi:hypothetical protein
VASGAVLTARGCAGGVPGEAGIRVVVMCMGLLLEVGD